MDVARLDAFHSRVGQALSCVRLEAQFCAQGLLGLASGLAVGLPVAFVASRVLGHLLFAVSPTDPATLIGWLTVWGRWLLAPLLILVSWGVATRRYRGVCARGPNRAAASAVIPLDLAY